MTRQDMTRGHEMRRDQIRQDEKRKEKGQEAKREKGQEEKRKAEKKEKRKSLTHTGLATSWHHFTWSPPQHQATQNPRASLQKSENPRHVEPAAKK